MDGNTLVDKRPPKRKMRNQAEWKREKRKRLIIAGESHLSVKGRLIAPKKIGADCKCKLKCYEKVEVSTRQMLFDGFYSLKTYDEQNAYLFGLIRKHDVKRKKNMESDRRTCTYKYYVRNRGKEIQVCKLAFAHIHAVSFRKIRTLSEKLDQNILFPRDGRGKHNNRPKKVSQETLDHIKHHIFSIIKSNDLKNFMKEDKNRQVVAELNVAKLYLNFLQAYEPEAVNVVTGQLNQSITPKVKSWLYRKVFHEEVKSKDFQTIKKRFDAFNTSRDDRGGPSTTEDIERPTKKSRRKGMARKIVDSEEDPLQYQQKPVHYPILTNYNTQTIDTGMQVPRMTTLPQPKPMQTHQTYQQDHSLQEFTHNLMSARINKDNRMPPLHSNISHHHPMPTFDPRIQHYADNQPQLDVNEMANAFMYSSNC